MRKPSGSGKKRVYGRETVKREAGLSIKKMRKEETARQRILQLLFLEPLQEFALSEIAELGKVSKSTASLIVLKLHKEGLVKLVQLSVVWRIQANYENPAFRREKILYNLSVIYRSGLVEYLNSIFGNPKAVVLFGSFSKGEDTMGSDIDIAIEDDSITGNTIASVKELESLERRIGRKITIHLFNRKDVDINLFNSIANGIVLSGFLEVKK